MKTVISVQARTGSTRLPRKILRPFYHDESILDILLERLNRTGLPVILATSIADADEAVEAVGRTHGVQVYRGSENDVVSRVVYATSDAGCSHIIRVCSDNPFLDLNLLMELHSCVSQSSMPLDYVAHQCDAKPSIATQYGVFAELVSRTALQRVLQETDEEVYREHVTNYIHQRPDEFSVRYLPIDQSNFLPPWVRLTVDTPNDFAIASDLYTRVRDRFSETFSVAELKQIIDADPQLRASMSGQSALVDKQFLLEKVRENA